MPDDTWPRVLLAPTRAAYIGPGMRLSPHRTAVTVVAVGLDEPFSLMLPDRGEPHATRLALIPAGTTHRLESSGRMAFVYLDVLSDAFGEQGRPALGHRRDDIEALYRALSTIGDGTTPGGRIERFCEMLGLPARMTPHAGIERVIRAIDREPGHFPSARRAAETAGLSVSRFQHVFGAATGTTFRGYRRWRRMMVVGV